MTKIKIVLSIFGENLDLETISFITKLKPSNSWKKGDKILGRKKELFRQENCWELNYDFDDCLFLDEISDQIVSDFSNNLDSLSKYINDNKLESKIYIIPEIIDNETPALYFNKSFLNMISKINGEIDIDLYII